jgi:hypothetical protein
MQAQVYFFGQWFATGVFVKGDGFLQGIHKDKAGMAIFHVTFQVLAELRVKLAVDVFRKLLQDFFALHGFPSYKVGRDVEALYPIGLRTLGLLPISLQDPIFSK